MRRFLIGPDKSTWHADETDGRRRTSRRWRGTRRSVRLLLALVAAVLSVAGVASATPSNGDYGLVTSPGAASWPTWQGDVNGSRYNAAESTITPSTVGNLTLKWAYAYNPVPYAAHGSQPAVVDGTLYVGAPDAKFLALDAVSGATKWTFDLTTVVPGATNDVRDGASVSNGIVYFGDSTGRIYALHADTGRLLWSTPVSNQANSRITSSPVVFGGKVYVGESTNESTIAKDPNYPCCTHRGQVLALDALTGAIDWQYWTVPPATQVGTWPSGAAKFSPAGGSVWAPPVIDPPSRTLFVGTGNSFVGAQGDTNSVLALDVDSGAVKWKQQVTYPDVYTYACTTTSVPNDYCPGKGTYALDADFGAAPTIVHTGNRTLVTIGQKGGAFHAFDAGTGQEVWKTQLEPLDPTASEPGGTGVLWGSSYDGNLIYAATRRGNPGKMFALDPGTGHVVWESDHPADGCTTGGAAASPSLCELAYDSAVSATPGLLYEGSEDGKFRIFSASTGQVLWTFDAVRNFNGVNGLPGFGTGISGTGGAVVVNGMVYVQASYYPFYPNGGNGGVLLAFGL